MDDDHVEKVLAVTRQNHRITVCEVAEEVRICKKFVPPDFDRKKRKMRRVDAKYVPRLLTRHYLSVNF